MLRTTRFRHSREIFELVTTPGQHMRVRMLDLIFATGAAAGVRTADTWLSPFHREHRVKLFFGEISIEIRNVNPSSKPSAST